MRETQSLFSSVFLLDGVAEPCKEPSGFRELQGNIPRHPLQDQGSRVAVHPYWPPQLSLPAGG